MFTVAQDESFNPLPGMGLPQVLNVLSNPNGYCIQLFCWSWSGNVPYYLVYLSHKLWNEIWEYRGVFSCLRDYFASPATKHLKVPSETGYVLMKGTESFFMPHFLGKKRYWNGESSVFLLSNWLSLPSLSDGRFPPILSLLQILGAIFFQYSNFNYAACFHGQCLVTNALFDKLLIGVAFLYWVLSAL